MKIEDFKRRARKGRKVLTILKNELLDFDMSRTYLMNKQYAKFLEKNHDRAKKERILESIIDVRMNEKFYSNLNAQMKKVELVAKFGNILKKRVEKKKLLNQIKINSPMTDQEAYLYALQNRPRKGNSQKSSSQSSPNSQKKLGKMGRKNDFKSPSPKSKKNFNILKSNNLSLKKKISPSSTFMGVIAAAQIANKVNPIDSERFAIQKEKAVDSFVKEAMRSNFRTLSIVNKKFKLPRVSSQTPQESIDESREHLEYDLAEINPTSKLLTMKQLNAHHILKGQRYKKYMKMKEIVGETNIIREKTQVNQAFLKQIGNSISKHKLSEPSISIENKDNSMGVDHSHLKRIRYQNSQKLSALGSNSKVSYGAGASRLGSEINLDVVKSKSQLKKNASIGSHSFIGAINDKHLEDQNYQFSFHRNPKRKPQVRSSSKFIRNTKEEKASLITRILKSQLNEDDMWNNSQFQKPQHNSSTHNKDRRDLQLEMEMMDERETIENNLYKRVIMNKMIEKGLSNNPSYTGKNHAKLVDEVTHDTQQLKK